MSNDMHRDLISEYWVFGYGSLIFKPPPHIEKQIPGFIKSYVRRFWQASGDHRGTPEAPGRVPTLIERAFWETLADPQPFQEDKVWGMAYKIKADKVEEVQKYLDVREAYGYNLHYTTFQPADGSSPIQTSVYIGTPENEHFTGPQPPQQLAEHILKSSGPSGSNKDYLLALEAALEEMHPESGDGHVRDLASRLRRLEAAEGLLTNQDAAQKHGLSKAGTDEQEKF